MEPYGCRKLFSCAAACDLRFFAGRFAACAGPRPVTPALPGGFARTAGRGRPGSITRCALLWWRYETEKHPVQPFCYTGGDCCAGQPASSAIRTQAYGPRSLMEKFYVKTARRLRKHHGSAGAVYLRCEMLNGVCRLREHMFAIV